MTICNKLDATTHHFWWNLKKLNGSYLAWKSWEVLCLPKTASGLGFRQANVFNQALLAKLTWLIAAKKKSLCLDAFRSKYKVQEDWLGKEPRKYASSLWKAIEKLNCVILKGACFVFVSGEAIDFWKDPWIPWIAEFKPKPRDPNMLCESLRVADLIVHGSNTWNFDLPSTLVDNESITTIAKVSLPANGAPDHLVWTLEERGNFTVKSAASMLLPSDTQVSIDPMWANLWKTKIHERLKKILWRLGSNALPTKANLASRFNMESLLCPLCHLEDESYSYLFLNCSKVKPIWFGLNWSLYSERLPLVSGADFLKFVINPPISLACSLDLKLIKAQTTIHLALTLKCIWNLRNQVVHNAQKINLLAVLTNLDLRIREHCQSFLTVGNQHICETVVWFPPAPQVVKLNVDAGFTNDNASIAVVARDSFGAILQCWSKCCNTTDPCIAEALTVVWALQLARLEKLVDIQVEGDAQVCINVINGPTAEDFTSYFEC